MSKNERAEKLSNTPPEKGKNSSPTLLDGVRSFIEKYVYLENADVYLLVALWVVATHLHEQFDFMGYLYAYSPEKQSGKSTLLKSLHPLVFNSAGLQVHPTPAVLFRQAKGFTQLLDEADSWTNMEELRSILNAGFEKGATVVRCGNQKSNFKLCSYPVYSPKALAGIGLRKLHDTTLDRTFAIPMVRQTQGEARERFRPRIAGPDGEAINVLIAAWAKTHKKEVADLYYKAEFPYLTQFGDRTKDIAEPLAVILEVMYGSGAVEQERQALTRAVAATRNEQQAETINHKILLRLLEAAEQEDPLVGSSTELLAHFANTKITISAQQLGEVLNAYGIKARSDRRPGEPPRKRYKISQAQLRELVERWVPKRQEQSESEPTEEIMEAVTDAEWQGESVVTVVSNREEEGPDCVGEWHARLSLTTSG